MRCTDNIKIIVFLSSIFLLCSCASPIYEGSFSIDKRIPENKRMEAVILTAQELNWKASFPKKGVYRIHVQRRHHKAVFDIICKKTSCITKYVSSHNLKYEASKHTIHRNYNKWVKTYISHLTDRLRLN